MKPRKWIGIWFTSGCCCYSSLLDWGARPWSSFVLQQGQLSWSLSHPLRQFLSKACPQGSSQVLLPFVPTFSRQMLQSASLSLFISGKFSRNSSLTPLDCGCSYSPLNIPPNICWIMLIGSAFLESGMFIVKLFVLLILTDGKGSSRRPESLVNVCTFGYSSPWDCMIVIDLVHRRGYSLTTGAV